MDLKRLPFNNLARHAGRTALLAALVALLSFTMLGSALMVFAMRRGLGSLESRLGADIIVAPKEAASKYDLEEVLVEGVPRSFYMNRTYLDSIAARDGVEMVSGQYYLATLKAGCCTMPVQVIGIDPETDFTIQPWIARSYSDTLGSHEVVAGCNIAGAPGTTILFYGVECTIVAKLDETGTSLDTAVFANSETVQDLIAAAEEKGLMHHSDYDPDEVVSVIQVKVAPGSNVTDVANDINLHVKGVKAVQAKAMTTGVADSIHGMSQIIGVLALVVLVLSIVILAVSFSAVGRQRTREFAVLRTMGAPISALKRIVFMESSAISCAGSLVGAALASITVIGFSRAIEGALGVPFLLPPVPLIVALILAVLLISMLAGSLASVFSAQRLANVDAGQILRGE